MGFASGNGGQAVSVNGDLLGSLDVSQSTLTATRKTPPPVPEPSTLVLFGTGMLGLLG